MIYLVWKLEISMTSLNGANTNNPACSIFLNYETPSSPGILVCFKGHPTCSECPLQVPLDNLLYQHSSQFRHRYAGLPASLLSILTAQFERTEPSTHFIFPFFNLENLKFHSYYKLKVRKKKAK